MDRQPKTGLLHDGAEGMSGQAISNVCRICQDLPPFGTKGSGFLVYLRLCTHLDQLGYHICTFACESSCREVERHNGWCILDALA